MSDEDKTVEVEQTVEDLIFSDEDTVSPTTETEDIIAEPEEDEEGVKTIAGGELEDEPTDTDNVTDITPEEDVDDLKSRLKFMQTSYQKQTELLKANDPDMYQQIQNQLKSERKGEATPEPTDVSDEDDFAVRIEKKIADGFNRLRVEQTSQINAEKYVQEYHTANASLETFKKDNNVSDEDMNTAFAEAARMGFDIETANQNYSVGVPTKAVDFIMKELQFQAMQNYLADGKVKMEAEVADKVTAVKTVEQPTAGALPEQKPKTREEKLLGKMGDLGASEAHSEVFE